MANTFVATVTDLPEYYVSVTATNTDAGNNDVTIAYRYFNQGKGLSIQTGTLTATTVTVLGSNNGSAYVDMTAGLFAGATSLSSDSLYFINNYAVPVKFLKIRSARTNATNANDMTIFAPNR